MKLNRLLTTVAIATGLFAGTAHADDMRIALVVKALGIGFFEAAAEAPKRPPENWAV